MMNHCVFRKELQDHLKQNFEERILHAKNISTSGNVYDVKRLFNESVKKRKISRLRISVEITCAMNISGIFFGILLVLLSVSMITAMPRRAKHLRRIRHYRIQAGNGYIGFVRFRDCKFQLKHNFKESLINKNLILIEGKYPRKSWIN